MPGDGRAGKTYMTSEGAGMASLRYRELQVFRPLSDSPGRVLSGRKNRGGSLGGNVKEFTRMNLSVGRWMRYKQPRARRRRQSYSGVVSIGKSDPAWQCRPWDATTNFGGRRGTEHRRKGVSAGASVCNNPQRFKAWNRTGYRRGARERSFNFLM